MSDYAAARAKMVDSQLRTEDVTDYRILGAMAEVARERFVPDGMKALAYIDEDIPLGDGAPARYLMEPAPLARLLQLAEISDTDIDPRCRLRIRLRRRGAGPVCRHRDRPRARPRPRR